MLSTTHTHDIFHTFAVSRNMASRREEGVGEAVRASTAKPTLRLHTRPSHIVDIARSLCVRSVWLASRRLFLNAQLFTQSAKEKTTHLLIFFLSFRSIRVYTRNLFMRDNFCCLHCLFGRLPNWWRRVCRHETHSPLSPNSVDGKWDRRKKRFLFVSTVGWNSKQ